jgi:predicted ArsR family transcriptional regulator
MIPFISLISPRIDFHGEEWNNARAAASGAAAETRSGDSRTRRPRTGATIEAVDSQDRVHRALAEPSRARLLALLEGVDAPLSSEELASRTGLHANTVRSHLEVLSDAGLVTWTLEPRTRPGRPRRLFAALPRPEAVAREHELLAGALAASLDPLPDGPRLAAQSGRSWGRELVDEPAASADEAFVRVVGLLAERGFAPVADGREITMCSCPFRELAVRYERIVCSLHQGLIDGALERLQTPLVLAELRPWATPDRCVARLEEPVAR